MLKLLAVHRDGSERVLHVQPSETEVLGRRAPRLALEDSCVSREHARVWFEDDCWWLSDLDSTHGTWVNHDPVDRPMPLHVGDEVRLGRMLLVVQEADASDGEPASASEADEPAGTASSSHRHAAGDRPAPEPDEPLQADEVIIAPSISLDAAQGPAPPAQPSAWPGTPDIFEPETQVTFTEPGTVDDTNHRREEDLDPLDDSRSHDPDATPTTLSAAPQGDPVAGNFGVIFPQVGRPGRGSRSHAGHTGRRSDGGQRHARWVTWTAVAIAGTMAAVAAVATTALLMYPG